ncbi:MAG: polysaccharide deacetylase family protein [Acidobacteriota bacterium]
MTDSGPSIAITFDGGASSNRTAELLDLLQTLEIKATLFLTGQFIEKHPALVRRAVLAGHEVGNHTFTHPHLTSWAQNRRHRTLPGITKAVLLAELERSERAFQKATGRPMAPFWRAPFGEENATLRAWALDAGYLHVRWSSLEGRSLDSLDWVEDEHSGLYRDSKRIMNTLLAFPRLEGGIVLMHLATDRHEAPWAHLPQFVEALRQRGIEPCKVTTLLRQSAIWKRWLKRAEERHRKLWH